MSGTLGIAVIGTGRMGSDHVRRIGSTVGGARVVAVADPDGDRVKEVAAGLEGAGAYTDAGAAIAAPGVDAVLIASPVRPTRRRSCTPWTAGCRCSARSP